MGLLAVRTNSASRTKAVFGRSSKLTFWESSSANIDFEILMLLMSCRSVDLHALLRGHETDAAAAMTKATIPLNANTLHK